MKKSINAIALAVFLVAAAATSQAALFRVGPSDVPSPPGNGFPVWYQDTTGFALDLCLPRTQAQLTAGVCLILPPDQDPIAGINLPIVFPTNFPDEAFYWNATALMDLPNNGRGLLVLALEAAFGGGPVAVGDQITFARIRIRVDAPVDGNYTVTHPFGQSHFPSVTAGVKAINLTSDVGIGAPGDFSGALGGQIGPFLLAAAGPGGDPLPFVTLSGDQFLSDAAVPVSVTGSPFGTNYFEVCVDAAGGLDGQGNPCIRVNEFTLMGKVHAGAIGSPLAIDRATYGRQGGAAHVDVFATASPGPNLPTPMLSLGDASGGGLMPSVLMHGPTDLGKFYGQSIPALATEVPASVIVTNLSDAPPSSSTQAIVDEVKILSAIYAEGTSGASIALTATSSDKGDASAGIAPPNLFVLGLPGQGATPLALASTGNPADPAEKGGTFPIPPVLSATSGPVAPITVIVISSAGGRDEEAITPTAGGTFLPGAPVAADDGVSLTAGSPSVSIAVTQNDSGADSSTVRIVSQGSNGVATVGAGGVILYTFADINFIGDDAFTYTVRSAPAPAGLESNVATVTITTTAPAGGPVPTAIPDGPFSVQVNASLTLSNLLTNDASNGGTLDPASVQIVSATGGTAVVSGTAGAVIYTAGAVAGNFGFFYTVANTNGQRSAPAFVSITIVPAADAITNIIARFRTGNRRWDVSGTNSVRGPGNSVTVVLLRGGAVIGTVGSAAVDNLGNWSFRVNNSSVIAAPGDLVRVTSTAGGQATAAVDVRN